jgi:glycosyltransferase involved in cell wall biosynthesis
MQQLFIGRGLRERGYSISFVTADHGQPDRETIDGMTIYKTFREDDGLPAIKFLHPRITTIWRAMKRADADVYYCRAAGFLPAVLSFFCACYGKQFVFAGAHDTDFLPGQELIKFSRDRFLYHYGLRRSSAVIVQSEYQKDLLWRNYGIYGEVIRNLFEGEAKAIPLENRRLILWVSTLRKWKRPLLFIELAKAFPDERFVMIGGPDGRERELNEEVAKECAALPNMEFLGFQPFAQTEQYFDQCRVFINTSEMEGFPNTFLQSWRRGIPVISYVDPDGIIHKFGLGRTVTTAEEMKLALKRVLSSFDAASEEIVSYVRKNHSENVFYQYVNLFERLGSRT